MKTIAQKLALLVSSTSISLIFVEMLVRLFIPQQLVILRPDIWRPDDTFGHRHHENANTIVNVGEGIVHFVTDSNGYRVNRNTPQNRTEPDVSILTIGDSFLEGLHVENEFTIPEVVRKYLEDKYNQSIQIDNTGVGAWNPNHYYLEAKRALAQKKAESRTSSGQYDLGIVFLYVANDIITTKVASFPPRSYATRHKLRLPQNLEWDEIIDAIFYPINDFLETRSHSFILFKKVARIQLAKIGLTAYHFPSIFEVEEASSSRWETTAAVCEEIQSEFSTYNTPVFFVLLPAAYQVHDDVFKEYIESFDIDPESVNLVQPNELLKDEFEARGLQLVDPLEYMKQKAENGLKMYGSVNQHFDEDGHQVVSEYILPIAESYLTR